MERRLHLVHGCVERQQETEETVLYFLIREAQPVGAELRVIPFEG